MNAVQSAGAILAGTALLVGLAFVLLGQALKARTRGWVRTQGTVVVDDEASAVRWTDESGRVHEQPLAVRRRGPAPGRPVPLIYDPAHPDRGMHDGAGLRGTPLLVAAGVVAVVGVAAGVGLILAG